MKDEIFAIADQLLRLTAASADFCPPLKSVAGGALHLAQLVQASACPDIAILLSQLELGLQKQQAVMEKLWRVCPGEYRDRRTISFG